MSAWGQFQCSAPLGLYQAVSPLPPTLGGEAEGPGMGSLEQGAES